MQHYDYKIKGKRYSNKIQVTKENIKRKKLLKNSTILKHSYIYKSQYNLIQIQNILFFNQTLYLLYISILIGHLHIFPSSKGIL